MGEWTHPRSVRCGLTVLVLSASVASLAALAGGDALVLPLAGAHLDHGCFAADRWQQLRRAGVDRR
ncbi:hypothetical protein WMF04_26965 [Sorangium sp. So ce260]|uniref:hypothetical protein n=1 Tax=Sorangium sp. So ce260 TaxID=3133291 RepID=UPI003F6411C9